MLDKALLLKFWKEFQLPIQDEDPEFPIANPQDAARTLIKCRNWVGIFSEILINTENERLNVRKEIAKKQQIIQTLRHQYLKELMPEFSAATLKTKDLQEALIFEKAKLDAVYKQTSTELDHLEVSLMEVDNEKSILENLLKRLEKSNDILIQYLNWVKYEGRK